MKEQLKMLIDTMIMTGDVELKDVIRICIQLGCYYHILVTEGEEYPILEKALEINYNNIIKEMIKYHKGKNLKQISADTLKQYEQNIGVSKYEKTRRN